MTGKKLTGWLPGFSLSEEGQRQAEAVAKNLEQIKIDAFYSSPLERCAETAAVIAEPRGKKVEIIQDVGEIRYGDWQGRSLAALARTKGWREMNAKRSDFRFPNGETPREAQTRAVAAIEKIAAAHKDQTVAVVSHADLIRLLVAAYVGLSLELYNRMSVQPASVTALALGERPRLLALNAGTDLSWLNRDRADGRKQKAQKSDGKRSR